MQKYREQINHHRIEGTVGRSGNPSHQKHQEQPSQGHSQVIYRRSGAIPRLEASTGNMKEEQERNQDDQS